MHRIWVITVALALVFLAAPPALAVAPPSIDPGAVPPDETGPDRRAEAHVQGAADVAGQQLP